MSSEDPPACTTSIAAASTFGSEKHSSSLTTECTEGSSEARVEGAKREAEEERGILSDL